jgi:nanoRNase/pAp phosphatase (c-di-AMP/oligoRNAs hydrolase)
MGKVDSADILVILADFFLRVHGLSTTMVSGINEDKLIVVFRGDGLRRDMGKFAKRLFGDVGSAGGHKSMARAEIPMEKLGCQHASQFIWERLHGSTESKKKKKEPESATNDGA